MKGLIFSVQYFPHMFSNFFAIPLFAAPQPPAAPASPTVVLLYTGLSNLTEIRLEWNTPETVSVNMCYVCSMYMQYN